MTSRSIHESSSARASTIPITMSRQAVSSLLWLAFFSTGCSTLKLAPPPVERIEPTPAPVMRSFRVSQFVFQLDFDLNQDQPIFAELAELREQIQRELKLPWSNALIQVVLFETRDKYEQFMQSKYPELPKRRAFFVAQPKPVGGGEDLLVYTFWGDRVRQDLRHELTHATLHSVLKDVPLWLDEGLAEYFEVLPGLNGAHPHHLELLRRHGVGPFACDLKKLEQLSQVQQMTPVEYRESWAWVHMMLRGRPEVKQVLLDYLQQLRTVPNPGSIQPKLAAVLTQPEKELTEHVAKLKLEKPPGLLIQAGIPN